LTQPIIKKSIETVERPWGYYEILSEQEDHQVKRITVRPGHRLSLQRHKRRSEHWYIIRGKAVVIRDQQKIVLTVGQSVDIPIKMIHRIANPGSEDLVFIEVQSGDYFEEDDIERLEDDFGRVIPSTYTENI